MCAAGRPGDHSFARRCVRRMPGSTRVLVSPPSLHPSYQVSTVLCSDPTSQPPFCLPRLFDLSGILVRVDKSRWDLTGCLVDMMCNANGPSTPGLRQSLARTRLPVLPSSMHKPWAGSESYKISGLNTVHGWTASPVHSSSLPFCVRFNAAVARRAATLDTGPVASSYPRGVSTRLSTNHFQSARSSLGSKPSPHTGWLGCGMPQPGPRFLDRDFGEFGQMPQPPPPAYVGGASCVYVVDTVVQGHLSGKRRLRTRGQEYRSPNREYSLRTPYFVHRRLITWSKFPRPSIRPVVRRVFVVAERRC
jgi:hypothetical protein